MLPSSRSLNTAEITAVIDPVAAGNLGLRPGENLLATLDADLNASLQFATSKILLTTERMISDSDGKGWTSWPLKPSLSLHHSDHAGVGSLALHDGDFCIARWRYTLAQDVAAVRLLQQFEKQQASRDGQIDDSDEHAARCPSCHSPLPDDSEELSL